MAEIAAHSENLTSTVIEPSQLSLLSNETDATIQIVVHEKMLGLTERGQGHCVLIALWVCIQTVTICIGAYTVLSCQWVVREDQSDSRKLATLMYLYDADSCGRNLNDKNIDREIQDMTSNDTEIQEVGGRPLKFSSIVKPIKREKTIKVVRNKVAARTRKYIWVSLGHQLLWTVLSLVLLVFAKTKILPQYLSTVMWLWIYGTIIVIILDILIALIYLADIQQCISKSMILRYSGWADVKLKEYDAFVGWIPLVAGSCWLRGILPFALNVYCASRVHNMKKLLKIRRVRKRLQGKGRNEPFPEVGQYLNNDPKVLHVKASSRI